MCIEADSVSGSLWAQYNMFIAQSVFFLSCPPPMAFIPFDFGICLPPFWFFHSFPSDLFPSCALSSSLASSLVLSILISLFFHLYKFVCHISTMFLLPFIFHVTLISDPFIFCHLCYVSQNLCSSFYGGFQHIWDRKRNTTSHLISIPSHKSFRPPTPNFFPALFFSHQHCHWNYISCHVPPVFVFVLMCVCFTFLPLYFHFPIVYSPINAIFIVLKAVFNFLLLQWRLHFLSPCISKCAMNYLRSCISVPSYWSRYSSSDTLNNVFQSKILRILNP